LILPLGFGAGAAMAVHAVMARTTGKYLAVIVDQMRFSHPQQQTVATSVGQLTRFIALKKRRGPVPRINVNAVMFSGL
jgi:hypothetical protein